MKAKQSLSLSLIFFLLFISVPALAEIPAEGRPFIVASATELSGCFFTGIWGNNTSDIDVRAMIHNYSPVVWSDQTSMEMNPLVVRDVSVGEYENGNRAYVITLHEDLFYCDGTPVLAADYVFSLMLQASPLIATLGGTSATGRQITGYEAYHSGASEAFSGLRLVDDYTFVIQVDGANYPFFYELSYVDVTPYPMAVLAPGCRIVDTDEGATIRNANAEATAPLFTAELLAQTILDPQTGYLSNPSVTCGAYRLTGYDPEEKVATFEINEYFKGTYDGIQPSISPIEYRAYPAQEMLDRLETGEIHLVNRLVSGETINRGLALTAAGETSSSNYPRMGLGYLNFACEGKVFASEAVRKAVAYAFDKETFCREFTSYAVPVYGYIGIGQWLYTAVTADGGASFAETDEETEAWKALSLDGLNKYEMDPAHAEQLLIDDGWTLNAQGEPYVKGTDAVRHKVIGGELTGLFIRWGKTENSAGADLMEQILRGPIMEIGMELIVEEVSFQEVLADYYRQQDRRYDMHMLASNVSNLFDPSGEYATSDADSSKNTSGFQDETLERIALEMRAVKPGDLLGYAAKWVEFQEYWNEKLPMLPLYSNIYFDFFIPELTNYRPDAEQNWPEAIVRATLTADETQEDVDGFFQVIE